MQLINKQDDLAFALFDFLQNSLQTLLKFPAVLCPGNQRAHIQRQYAAGRILTKLNGRTAVPLEQLAQSLSCEPTDLYDTILWMISMDYFGDGAELDTEKKTLYCTRRPDEPA